MKITAVGGYNEVGGNMTGVEVGREKIVFDCGIRLDTLQMYDSDTQRLRKLNVDDLISKRIIPNYHLIEKNLRGILISHGHLDHIGALPLIKPKSPIYLLPYNGDLSLKEYQKGKYQRRNYHEPFSITKEIKGEFIEVTHSIPYSSIVSTDTPGGKVVYASDFRLDNHSQIAKTDYKRLEEIGKEGVHVLIVESLRVGQLGSTPSEKTVKEEIKNIFENIHDGLIITTTFSSHIERIQCIIDEAEKLGRKIVMLGRSLNAHSKIGEKYGLLNVPDETKAFANSKGINMALKEIKKNREDYLLITTGHQGEPDSVLSRISNGKFDFSFEKNDSVVFCASTIPTPINIASRYTLETKLKFRKVRLFETHTHGHASKEDHRNLLRILRPENIIPCHGTSEMISNYVKLGIEEGYNLNENLYILSDGSSIEI